MNNVVFDFIEFIVYGERSKKLMIIVWFVIVFIKICLCVMKVMEKFFN